MVFSVLDCTLFWGRREKPKLFQHWNAVSQICQQGFLRMWRNREEKAGKKQRKKDNFWCSSEEPGKSWRPFLFINSVQGWDTTEIFQPLHPFKAHQGSYSILAPDVHRCWAELCPAVHHHLASAALSCTPCFLSEDTSAARQLDWRGEQQCSVLIKH